MVLENLTNEKPKAIAPKIAPTDRDWKLTNLKGLKFWPNSKGNVFTLVGSKSSEPIEQKLTKLIS